jgi:hypothetical protein
MGIFISKFDKTNHELLKIVKKDKSITFNG